ncbi:endo-1,4-beta-xylanase [Amycolatopsis sp. YIM 10]|uniref:endo-1,4-beta-xylanase n=1 Tax=Amycolatopsis sp. YIM 10 TaxID=2653857 RepID=UPI00129013D0|nr:endo-1,4-beta-xylanase [Amycolatopsis sp. YIM 10]QFU89119.1 Endo-1,4-beta-xylanase A precursor [Amycolatopsis sp. YIM 10]
MLRAKRATGALRRFGTVLALSAGLVAWQAAPASAAPPLKDITNRYVGSAVPAGALANEADFRTTLTREFDSVTPENEMKWASLEPNRGQYNWSGADSIVNYAQQNGKSVRGHTLVWHNQYPGWLNSLSANDLRAAVQKHITTVMTRYKGKIRAWDVVNEVFNEDGSRRDSIFQQKLGSNYIADAFRWAKQADPGAKLYINDYNVEWQGPKSNAMYELVKSLRQQGVPVEGAGFQTHLSTQYGFPGGFQANLQRFADLGVDVAITEADVRVQLPADTAKLNKQADYFDQAWDGCQAVSRCVEFTTWGFTDRHSWVPGTFPGEGAACLFDSSLKPKPAYTRINP